MCDVIHCVIRFARPFSHPNPIYSRVFFQTSTHDFRLNDAKIISFKTNIISRRAHPYFLTVFAFSGCDHNSCGNVESGECGWKLAWNFRVDFHDGEVYSQIAIFYSVESHSPLSTWHCRNWHIFSMPWSEGSMNLHMVYACTVRCANGVKCESRISFAAAAVAVDTHDTVSAGDSSVDNKKC